MPSTTDSLTTDTTLVADTAATREATATSPDTAQQAPAVVLPWDTVVCRQVEAPLTASERELYRSLNTTYMSGLPAEPRQPRAVTDSGLLSLLTVTFLLVAFSFKHCVRMFKALAADLWSVRRRANAFDEPTANETRVMIVLLLQLWVCEGLLIYAALTRFGVITSTATFTPIIAMTGFAAAFYIAQLIIYKIVGYTFTDSIGTSQWIKGFNSSSAFLGMALMIPALVTIFYPSQTEPMLWVAAALYVVARIMFIIKGFRIFYNNFSSLLYFILYLCALELVPLILAAAFVTYLGHLLA